MRGKKIAEKVLGKHRPQDLRSWLVKASNWMIHRVLLGLSGMTVYYVSVRVQRPTQNLVLFSITEIMSVVQSRIV